MEINIIGDIAGRYDEFQKLLEIMPEADLTIAVGDLIDRGPKSKEVIEWFMNNPKSIAIYGNHEDLMIKAIESRRLGDVVSWCQNGGDATLESFGDFEGISGEVTNWIKNLPLTFENKEIIVTHAPLNNGPTLTDKNNIRANMYIWNRATCQKRHESKFKIYGHNSYLKIQRDEKGPYSICIDNSYLGYLCGLHWPTGKIYSVRYFDKEETSYTLPESIWYEPI